jgi:hypothetical protein
MQKTILESAVQPYLKLALSNLELMKHFSVVPALKPATTEESKHPFLVAQSQLAQLTQSVELTHIVQAALKNYTEFLLEVGQSNLFVVSQAQETLARSQDSFVRQGQSVVENIVAAAEKSEKSEKSDKRKHHTEVREELQEA